MSVFLLLDGVLYRSRPTPDQAGRAWEPAFPNDFDILSAPKDPPPEPPATSRTPPAFSRPAPEPPRPMAVPAGLMELWQLGGAVPPAPKAPPSGNSEVAAKSEFRPLVHIPRTGVAPPDLGQVEPVDPDSSPDRHRPEQPVLVSRVMSRPADCLIRTATVAEARQAMEHGHYHHLPVVDEEHRLVGVLSDRDILAAGAHQSVADVMTSPVLVASPSTPLYLACEGLWAQKVSCLPVIDGNFRPVGILTVFDVLRHLAGHPQHLYTLE